MTEGDILGHEPMGIVEEVGPEVTQISPGDRVVIPFNISCGHRWMCDRQLFAQCEKTQNRLDRPRPQGADDGHQPRPRAARLAA